MALKVARSDDGKSGWRTMATDGKFKLDDVDRQILTALQADGRMTNVELAKRAGISAPPCLRRVRVLEDSGIIEKKGTAAELLAAIATES